MTYFDSHYPRFERLRKSSEKRFQTVSTDLAGWACEGKKMYKSEKAARIALRGFRRSAGEDIVAYRCPINGGHWHLGNRK